MLLGSSRPPTGCDNDDSYYSTLIKYSSRHEDVDTYKDIPVLSTGSTVVIERGDGRLMHGTMGWHGADDQNGRSYKVRVMKTSHIITRMKRHVRAIPILAEDYPMKEISKSNRLHTDDRLNELTDYFAMLNQHEHLGNTEAEREDISQKTMQQPQHANTDQLGEIKQSSSSHKISKNSKRKHKTKKWSPCRDQD